MESNLPMFLGLMSGTSLDGLDLALISFVQQTLEDGIAYTVHKASTLPYSSEWENRLATAHTLLGAALIELDRAYGAFLGEQAASFILNSGVLPSDVIVCSHGHTIFHAPESGYTYQIGAGAALAQAAGMRVIADFRSDDIAAGGQGAPLVPIGDRLLFSSYAVCINLGGFANISYEQEGKRIAYDVCPLNIVFNQIAAERGLLYDDGGNLARSGTCDLALLGELNSLPFYAQSAPKSLGREWLEAQFLPIMNRYTALSPEDKLRSLSEHAANMLVNAIKKAPKGDVLLTGGGTYNRFLQDLTQTMLQHHTLIIPPTELINFKEAIVFALLGYLRYMGQSGNLAESTGARYTLPLGSFSGPWGSQV
jgi:anhydro-N-acetylmuramic acid kinase